MSDAKHTAGPWAVGKYGTSVKKSDGFGVYFTRSKGSGGGDSSREDARIRADALLVAAAPDLLEALEAYVAEDYALSGFDDGIGGGTQDDAEAAIAKAKGANI